MWGKIQDRTNSEKNKKPNTIYASKPKVRSNTHNKNAKFPCAEVQAALKCYCYILPYVVCHCVIYVVECGAYMGSKSHIHDLQRLYTQSEIFLKRAHRNMDLGRDGKETIQPDCLEAICSTVWLTRLSAVIWNK